MAEIAAKADKPTRLVALVWPLSNLPQNEIHRICSDRIIGRGENHQSLRPVETGEHEVILVRFFSQYEPYEPAFNAASDGKFDDTIEMNVAWDFETSIKHVIEELLKIGDVLGVYRPNQEQLEQAMEKTLGYKPSIIKEMHLEGLNSSSKGGGTSKGARYHGIAVEVDLPSLLDDFFSSRSDLSSTDKAFYDLLKKNDRIEKKPHVTLVHERELELAKDGSNAADVEYATMLWERCKAVEARWGEDAVQVTLTLGPLLVWDGQAMSIQVSDVQYGGSDVKKEDMPCDKRKNSYHITVGTLNQDIRPVEGKFLLENAMKGENLRKAGKPLVIEKMDTVEVKGRVRGLF